jgi:hypothetical protein
MCSTNWSFVPEGGNTASRWRATSARRSSRSTRRTERVDGVGIEEGRVRSDADAIDAYPVGVEASLVGVGAYLEGLPSLFDEVETSPVEVDAYFLEGVTCLDEKAT